ncbi:hypothetical protein E2562_031869 [Oryza meyeriana var. granulata]|uniref:Uncharacterized protein n=1 Tax=Oryza meyeriana var. granulata TaxID=110450 RepID=A0A6G1CIZ1_9ORYZ|nr:hypothetical protein E2562_031869 [Oryza meyeriana var. granulata]
MPGANSITATGGCAASRLGGEWCNRQQQAGCRRWRGGQATASSEAWWSDSSITKMAAQWLEGTGGGVA